MPCYLFTYHTYGSWLPDHPKGFVIRKAGVQLTHVALAQTYRQRMTQSEVALLEKHQLTVIKAIQAAAKHIGCRAHFVATNPTHIHVLTSWRDNKGWKQKRNSYKRRITISLKSEFEQRNWLSDNASRNRVSDREHFVYLMTTYLPGHRGSKWSERTGLFR
jgi:REP element-mobilizing transposase RayT